jgi:enamine deaminase RidA (YjgF/YER057c/UK114 family)
VAPFSYGIKVRGGGFLFIPNQIPVNSKGEIVGRGDIVAQATKVFENLKSILAEVDLSFENLVKITWYLTSREDWKPVVKIRERYFKDNWPAATFVLLEKLSRDDVLVEMNAIAVIS